MQLPGYALGHQASAIVRMLQTRIEHERASAREGGEEGRGGEGREGGEGGRDGRGGREGEEGGRRGGRSGGRRGGEGERIWGTGREGGSSRVSSDAPNSPEAISLWISMSTLPPKIL